MATTWWSHGRPATSSALSREGKSAEDSYQRSSQPPDKFEAQVCLIPLGATPFMHRAGHFLDELEAPWHFSEAATAESFRGDVEITCNAIEVPSYEDVTIDQQNRQQFTSKEIDLLLRGAGSVIVYNGELHILPREIENQYAPRGIVRCYGSPVRTARAHVTRVHGVITPVGGRGGKDGRCPPTAFVGVLHL